MPTRSRFTKWAVGLTIVLLLAAAAVLAACGAPAQAPTPCPESECPEAEECPAVEECPDCPETVCPAPPAPVVANVPFEAEWASSPHNDATAEAFRHWDEDDPAEVSASCARCHSTPGYRDYLGVDGTEAGVVDNAAAIGTTVECISCHNEATLVMDSVVMPSGEELTGLGDEARCMVCHQGRASTVSVLASIEEAAVADDDTVSEDLGFINIHYYAAAATRFGTWAKGGFQYDGKMYDAKFGHVAELDTCISCHDPHTLEVKVDTCVACHQGVESADDLKEVRLFGSTSDYDGDGDVTEGIYYEIEGLRDVLYGAMQSYADSMGSAIGYDAASYPYFFVDSDGSGVIEEGEAVRDNAFASWTARLVKAAYNYQTSLKDPGGFAHGGKYMIQLLYDSIEDLDAGMVEGLARIDAGHFAGSQEAWRHWDDGGEVEADCARCHSATGLPVFIENGVNVPEPLSNGLLCQTCHSDLATFERYEVAAVPFPSGASLDTGNPDSNLCINCHQGRESTVSVDRAISTLAASIAQAAESAETDDEDVAIEELTDDTASESLAFRNVHYFAAGATLFGTDARGGYEYDGQTYVGRFEHVDGYDSCVQCHDAHALEVKVDACSTCHSGIEEPEDIRISKTDFDGDGDVEEGIAGEIATLHEALYSAIQEYANDAEVPIVYDSHAYPYFFADTNGNGEADADEANYGNRYTSWTPRLLRAGYNYQYASKDTGGFAHNGKYILQLLYDSLEDIGGDVDDMVRPEIDD